MDANATKHCYVHHILRAKTSANTLTGSDLIRFQSNWNYLTSAQNAPINFLNSRESKHVIVTQNTWLDVNKHTWQWNVTFSNKVQKFQCPAHPCGFQRYLTEKAGIIRNKATRVQH